MYAIAIDNLSSCPDKNDIANTNVVIISTLRHVSYH